MNGLFTQNNGHLAFGLHLFRRVDIIDYNDSIMPWTDEIVIAVNELIHPEMGRVRLIPGTRIKVFTVDEWLTIDTPLEPVPGGFKFTTIPYTPTEQEENAYETGWYD